MKAHELVAALCKGIETNTIDPNMDVVAINFNSEVRNLTLPDIFDNRLNMYLLYVPDEEPDFAVPD